MGGHHTSLCDSNPGYLHLIEVIIMRTEFPSIDPCPGKLVVVGLLLLIQTGCSSSFEEIDQHVVAMMKETNNDIGGDLFTPIMTDWDLDEAERATILEYDPNAEFIPTVNPDAVALKFVPSPEEDAENVIARLERYNNISEDAHHLDLIESLAYSIKHSREYRFAEEEFVLASLRLLIEQHRWGPRFFDEVSATIDGNGNDGFYDTSFQLVNEFRVTQRLPYGGTVSARALSRATEELHGMVFDGDTNSTDIILSADIPLLRGAGNVAREDLIQNERNMIYAARSFENFRREFLVDISRDFLNLVFQNRSINNSQRRVESSERVENRQRALYESGRIDRFDASLAENNTVNARDSLNRSQESYRLSVDQFKVRIGMPIDQDVIIDESNLGLQAPLVSINDAVRIAMALRLDLQNQRDQLGDAKRQVDNARNDLLPDLDFDASVTFPTDPDRDNGDFDFSPDDMDFRTGITFGLPLDREIERINVRQAQINLERSRRRYEQFRDGVATEVRAAVRSIDAALFSLDIQERGVEIANQGIASILAAPDRADARAMVDAIDDQIEAKDGRDRAKRDLEIAILFYLRDSGQLRVDDNGTILPLQGMVITPKDPTEGDDEADNPILDLAPLDESGS
ncbi:MAG: TolC family protein [Planctomycetota bacterium]|nr:TolC family protein [Planctomycetota bacterium]